MYQIERTTVRRELIYQIAHCGLIRFTVSPRAFLSIKVDLSMKTAYYVLSCMTGTYKTFTYDSPRVVLRSLRVGVYSHSVL